MVKFDGRLVWSGRVLLPQLPARDYPSEPLAVGYKVLLPHPSFKTIHFSFVPPRIP